MSDERKPRRADRPIATSGTGRTIEEAHAAKLRAKREQVPIADIVFPAALDSDGVDAEIRRRVACALTDLAEINTLVRQAPAGLTDEFVEGVQLRLLDAYEAFDDIWQSVNDASAGSLGGWMLRQQRLGLAVKGGEFTVTLPWEKNGKNS